MNTRVLSLLFCAQYIISSSRLPATYEVLVSRWCRRKLEVMANEEPNQAHKWLQPAPDFLGLTTFDLSSTVGCAAMESQFFPLIIKFSTLLRDTRTSIQIYPYVINSILTLLFRTTLSVQARAVYEFHVCARERERPRALVFSKASTLVRSMSLFVQLHR
jgi:hypothetical protein